MMSVDVVGRGHAIRAGVTNCGGSVSYSGGSVSYWGRGDDWPGHDSWGGVADSLHWYRNSAVNRLRLREDVGLLDQRNLGRGDLDLGQQHWGYRGSRGDSAQGDQGNLVEHVVIS